MMIAAFRDKEIHIGDTIKVSYNIVEGGKSRIQAFEGILIAMKGRAENKTFTVRRIGDRNVGVERIWPLNSRSIVDIVIVKNPKKVRRSKLYFLRSISGKMASHI